MTEDYNNKLAKDYEDIRGRVERGMLPLVARLPAIEKAVSEYVMARDNHLETRSNPPIAYRDEKALHRFADLVLHEELSWSHADKMSIVEYPVMSDRQEQSYYAQHTLKGDLHFGDLRYLGRRNTISETVEGDAPSVTMNRIIDPDTSSEIVGKIDVHTALETAGLTDRQREVIELVFFEDLTSGEVAIKLDVNRRTINYHLEAALNKLRKVLPETAFSLL